MKIFQRLRSKNTWAYWIIITLTVLLFKGLLASKISLYLSFLPNTLIEGIAILIILMITESLAREVLEA